MPDYTKSGHMDWLIARRAVVIAANPGHAARILGKPPQYVMPKEHRITVNCKTGERTVETIDLQPTRPVYLPFRPKPPVEPRRLKDLTLSQR
jgi:hypothetical protein